MEPPRADGLRVIRMVLGVLVVAVVALAVLVAVAFSSINGARTETVVRSCQDSNARHDNTIRRLDQRAARLKAEHPGQAAQIERSRVFTVSLIDQLSPKTDCTRRARRLTK